MARPKTPARGKQALPDLPATVRLHIVPGGREWHFRRRLALVLAALALLLTITFGQQALGLALQPGPVPKRDLLQAHALTCLMLAAALHLGSLRWHVRIDGSGVCVDRSSWLWPRQVLLPRSALVGLTHQLSYTVTSGEGSRSENTVQHHAVYVPLARGKEVKLTPALPGPAAAAAMIQHLYAAVAEPPTAPAAAATNPTPGRWPQIAWGGWLAVVVLGWLLLLAL